MRSNIFLLFKSAWSSYSRIGKVEFFLHNWDIMSLSSTRGANTQGNGKGDQKLKEKLKDYDYRPKQW